MDAGIRDGNAMECGGVGAVNGVSPVRAALKVMRESGHSLMAGSGAVEFAGRRGVPEFGVVLAGRPKRFEEYGTVGAVALDARGSLASAVSTGGVRSKSAGRMGNSAVFGAGYYADDTAAAVATGNGDIILKAAATKAACCLVASGMPPQEAADEEIRHLGDMSGKGGVILMARDGTGISFNTGVMSALAGPTT